MAPGLGIKRPVPRTRTGCLTCRKRKVKCDEAKPNCERCTRLKRDCVWSDGQLQLHHPQRPKPDQSLASLLPNAADFKGLPLESLLAAPIEIAFPKADRPALHALHHFSTFCSRVLVYVNDGDGNPFQRNMIPQAMKSDAMYHSLVALAAGHMSRGQPSHKVMATKHYMLALRALNDALSDADNVTSDEMLGACLILCIYEICDVDRNKWYGHLEGARELIRRRGGFRQDDYLSRFFSLLDISGSLASGHGPLLSGNYWLEDELAAEERLVTENGETEKPKATATWPYYDTESTMVDLFHHLMTYMARFTRLSAESMDKVNLKDAAVVREEAFKIRQDLHDWWMDCPVRLREQSNDWRRQYRPRKLTVAETLEEEAATSIKSCMYGCVIYINHLSDPYGLQPQSMDVTHAIQEILEIARETPEGYGLEMGLYWGLFMAGTAIFNDEVAEELLRKKLQSDPSLSIYHATKPLELLEALWKEQRESGQRVDWRLLQKRLNFTIFLFA